MNLYTIVIMDENGTKGQTGVKAKNKLEAINIGVERLTKGSWRAADRIKTIDVIEDAGNRELSVEDYK